jgi:hypothetical protein
MPAGNTFDWELLERIYLSGAKLKSLSFEATQNPLRPKFSTLRTYASRHSWQQKKRDFWKSQNNINNPLSEKSGTFHLKSSETEPDIQAKSAVNESEPLPSKPLSVWDEVHKQRIEQAEFYRKRVEAAEVERLERQAQRRFDSFGRRLF